MNKATTTRAACVGSTEALLDRVSGDYSPLRPRWDVGTWYLTFGRKSAANARAEYLLSKVCQYA